MDGVGRNRHSKMKNLENQRWTARKLHIKTCFLCAHIAFDVSYHEMVLVESNGAQNILSGKIRKLKNAKKNDGVHAVQRT